MRRTCLWLQCSFALHSIMRFKHSTKEVSLAQFSHFLPIILTKGNMKDVYFFEDKFPLVAAAHVQKSGGHDTAVAAQVAYLWGLQICMRPAWALPIFAASETQVSTSRSSQHAKAAPRCVMGNAHVSRVWNRRAGRNPLSRPRAAALCVCLCWRGSHVCMPYLFACTSR